MPQYGIEMGLGTDIKTHTTISIQHTMTLKFDYNQAENEIIELVKKSASKLEDVKVFRIKGSWFMVRLNLTPFQYYKLLMPRLLLDNDWITDYIRGWYLIDINKLEEKEKAKQTK